MKPYEKFDLTGKTAFVTGGGAGLGYHLARGLALSGATVILAARRESLLRDACAALTKETGATSHFVTIDLQDRGNLYKVAQEAGMRFGGIDIFVGNAATDSFQRVDAIDSTEIDRVFQTNYTANVELTKLFLPHMRARKWGRIIYCSSITSIRANGMEGLSTYSASKGALNSYAQVAASEVGRDNVTINCLNLGVYWTEMLEHVINSVEAAQGKHVANGIVSSVKDMTSLGRLGHPEELEGVIQFLASEAGSYITGSLMVVDGGLSTNMKAIPQN